MVAAMQLCSYASSQMRKIIITTVRWYPMSLFRRFCRFPLPDPLPCRGRSELGVTLSPRLLFWRHLPRGGAPDRPARAGAVRRRQDGQVRLCAGVGRWQHRQHPVHGAVLGALGSADRAGRAALVSGQQPPGHHTGWCPRL